MRYMLATLLAVGLSLTPAAPAALAQSPGQGCYDNGVAHSCTSPAPLNMDAGSGPGTVAGPDTPIQAPPFYGGDRN